MRRDEFVIRATELFSPATDATVLDAKSRSPLTCRGAGRGFWEARLDGISIKVPTLIHFPKGMSDLNQSTDLAARSAHFR